LNSSQRIAFIVAAEAGGKEEPALEESTEAVTAEGDNGDWNAGADTGDDGSTAREGTVPGTSNGHSPARSSSPDSDKFSAGG